MSLRSLNRRACAARALAAALLPLAVACTQAGEGPRIALSQGPAVGAETDGIHSFMGLPYAAPPGGERRWTAPQPHPAWTEARDATIPGPACRQNADRFSNLTPPVQSEDCLYLNVWAPAQAKAPLPVMVWFHGGANRLGAATLPYYDGAKLARHGVVVVTANYRLGYLGFFAHDALPDDGGNFGFMDQVAALRWVRAEIARFGGDPDNVTVFGQSAGGADTLYLMGSPAARGLFQRAIVQSGGGWGPAPDRQAMAERQADALEAAGIDPDLDAETLRALPAERLLQAQSMDKALGFGPFRDGVNVVEAVYETFAAGRQAPIPLLVGSNTWEANLLEAGGDLGFTADVLARLTYVWYRGRADDLEARKALLFADVVFNAPARWLAAQHSERAPTYLYRFGHVTTGKRDEVPGAGHGAEIPYVFDTLGATPSSAANAHADDHLLADELADCWVAFAKRGEPLCPLAAWRPYDPQTDRLLTIDRGAREAPVPDAATLDSIQRWFGPGALLGPR